jgi:hypothetical protein
VRVSMRSSGMDRAGGYLHPSSLAPCPFAS